MKDVLNRNFEDVLKRNANGDDSGDVTVDHTNGKPPVTMVGTDTYSTDGTDSADTSTKTPFKQKVLSTTDKFGVSQAGNLSGFFWGLAIGVLIVWQWKNIVKVGNSLFSKK